MADEIKETVILNFTVDQGKAEKDLLAVQAVIIENKKEQAELNKAYKAGVITQKEYLKENLRLQQNLKKEQEQTKVLTKLLNTESNSRNAIKARISELVKEYDNLNTATAEGAKREKELADELTHLNAQITKTSKNAGLFKDQIGNYPQAFQQAASKIQVAGTSVGDMGTKLAAFVTPAGAVVGVLGALTAAYAASSTGARDLAFAQTKLSTGAGILLDDFGKLIGGPEGGGGKGPVSRLLDGYLGLYKGAINLATYGLLDEYLDDVGDRADKAAKAIERLQELQISLSFAKGFAKEDERRAELQRRIRDDETKSLQERLEAAEKIDPILENSAKRTVIVLQAQIAAIKESTVNYDTNRKAQLEVANITAEISDKEEEITGKLTENVAARANLVKLMREELELSKLVADLEERKRTGADAGLTNIDTANLGVATADQTAASTPEAEKQAKDLIEGNAKLQLDARAKLNADLLKLDEKAGIEEIRNKNAVAAAKVATDKATAAASAQILGEASELFNESTGAYKVLASAQTLISTYLSAQKAFEALAGIPFVGPGLGAAAAAIAIAQGLQRVATINGIEFFDGGYTGAGNPRQAAGVVHRNEYVTPSKVVNRPEAQPHLQALERMRGGYFDGGFVTNQNTSQAQQALIMANALRNMPAPVVSVVEINRGQKRVAVRETQARI
jgi:hypothetical protein